jgi:hypothetical protein
VPDSHAGAGACPRVPAQHHDELRLGLVTAGHDLVGAAPGAAFTAARDRLVTFCVDEVLTHLEHDEAWLTRAEHCQTGRLLALAMRAEARAMQGAVLDLAVAHDACEAMSSTRVLHTLLAAHTNHQALLVQAVGVPSS